MSDVAVNEAKHDPQSSENKHVTTSNDDTDEFEQLNNEITNLSTHTTGNQSDEVPISNEQSLDNPTNQSIVTIDNQDGQATIPSDENSQSSKHPLSSSIKLSNIQSPSNSMHHTIPSKASDLLFGGQKSQSKNQTFNQFDLTRPASKSWSSPQSKRTLNQPGHQSLKQPLTPGIPSSNRVPRTINHQKIYDFFGESPAFIDTFKTHPKAMLTLGVFDRANNQSPNHSGNQFRRKRMRSQMLIVRWNRLVRLMKQSMNRSDNKQSLNQPTSQASNPTGHSLSSVQIPSNNHTNNQSHSESKADANNPSIKLSHSPSDNQSLNPSDVELQSLVRPTSPAIVQSISLDAIDHSTNNQSNLDNDELPSPSVLSPLSNESTNQSTNLSISRSNHSANQSNNQSISQPMNRSVIPKKAVSLMMGNKVNDRLGMTGAMLGKFYTQPKAFQLLGLFDQSINQSVNQSNSQALSRSVNQSIKKCTMEGVVISGMRQLKSGSVNQSIKQAVYRSIKQKYAVLTLDSLFLYPTEQSISPEQAINLLNGCLIVRSDLCVKKGWTTSINRSTKNDQANDPVAQTTIVVTNQAIAQPDNQTNHQLATRAYDQTNTHQMNNQDQADEESHEIESNTPTNIQANNQTSTQPTSQAIEELNNEVLLSQSSDHTETQLIIHANESNNQMNKQANQPLNQTNKQTINQSVILTGFTLTPLNQTNQSANHSLKSYHFVFESLAQTMDWYESISQAISHSRNIPRAIHQTHNLRGDHSINQSSNLSTELNYLHTRLFEGYLFHYQPITPSLGSSVSQSMDGLIDHLIEQSNNQSGNPSPSFMQSVHQSINQSMNHWVSRYVILTKRYMNVFRSIEDTTVSARQAGVLPMVSFWLNDRSLNQALNLVNPPVTEPTGQSFNQATDSANRSAILDEQPFSFVVSGSVDQTNTSSNNHSFLFAAASDDDRRSWIQSISLSINHTLERAWSETQSNNHSIDQSLDQSLIHDRSLNQFVDHATDQSTIPALNSPISRHSQPIGISHPFNQSIHLSNDQSTNQSINQHTNQFARTEDLLEIVDIDIEEKKQE